MSEWSKKRIKDITVKVGSGATPRGGQSVYIDKGYGFKSIFWTPISEI